MRFKAGMILLFAAGLAAAQEAPRAPQPEFTIDTGTKIPLSLINSVSTKHSAVGDRLYLETAFPILAAAL